MPENVRIIFEKAGFPRELSDAAEWTRAITDRSLSAATLVTVHRGGEPVVVVPAVDVPELRLVLLPDAVLSETRATDAVVVAAAAPPMPAPVPAPSAPVATADPTLRSSATSSEPELGRWEPDDRTIHTAPEPYRPVSAASANGRAKVLMAVVAGILLLVLLVANLPNGRSVDADLVDMSVDNAVASDPVVPVETGQLIAENVAYEWTDTGEPRSYAVDGLQLVLASETGADGARLPVLTVRSADLGDGKVVGVAGGDTAGAKFMLIRPTRADRLPSVLFLTYSMGAHCCTSVKLLTAKQTGWALADLGQWDGEPFGTPPTDVDGDGQLDFIMADNAFLYAFASYAESRAPSRVFNVVDGRFEDRTTASRFASVHRADMARTRAACGQHQNGACAAFVASAARVGQGEDALQFAAVNFDPTATTGWLPTRCTTQRIDGACPTGGEEQPAGFIEALDWFLQDHGYTRGSLQSQSPQPPEATDTPVAPDSDFTVVDNQTDGDGE